MTMGYAETAICTGAVSAAEIPLERTPSIRRAAITESATFLEKRKVLG
jgi:hypothetical protein